MWTYVLRLGRTVAVVTPHLRRVAPRALFVALALALAAVWWLGPRWSLNGEFPLASWQARSLVTLAAVLLVTLLWGLMLARRLRQNQQSQTAVAQEQEDPVLPFERKQQRLLDRQLAALRGKHSRRHGAYRLPWYLVMGLENAGKTSLIQGCGQSWALSDVTRNNRTDRNPFGFDWWVADTGLMIDPAGELLGENNEGGISGEIQHRLWRHFLGWLQRNRSHQPLNGVLMVIDLAQLSMAGEPQSQAQAIVLRNRLRELMEKTGPQLPIYICFTKMDLLYGFESFAASWPKAELEQPLGFTFELHRGGDNDRWLTQFAERYEQLVQGLMARLPEVLGASHNAETRAAAYSFTRQMAGLAPVLEAYLATLLAADGFSNPALVRGSYFTSVRQEGVPEDAFVTAAAANYRLTGPVQPAQRQRRSVPMFASQLFASIFMAEEGLAGQGQRCFRRQRQIAVAAVLALAAGGLMSAGWQHYFTKNAEAALMVEAQVQAFLNSTATVNVDRAVSGAELLGSLNRLRDATLAFGERKKAAPWLRDMGLYRGDQIAPALEGAYRDMLAYQFLPALMFAVSEQMVAAPGSPRSPGSLGLSDSLGSSNYSNYSNGNYSNDSLEHLRVLRMLYDASGRRKDMVRGYLQDYWQRLYPGQRERQEQLLTHLDYGLENTNLAGWAEAGDVNARMVLAPFSGRVEWAQYELGRVPTLRRVYRDLEQAAARQLPPARDLARSSGPAFATVFGVVDADTTSLPSVSDDNPMLIPALFTRDSLQKWFLDRAGRVTELALIDAWVLGRRDNIDFSPADQQQLQAGLHNIYSQEYVRHWRGALSRLKIHRFEDLNHGVRILESLGSSYQPLASVLQQLRENTSLAAGLSNDLRQASPAAAGLALTPAQVPPRLAVLQNIERQFSDLNRLTLSQGEDPSELDEIMLVVAELHQYLRNIQEAPDSGKSALAAARARLDLEGADPIFTLQRMAAYQPEPLNRMLGHLASESWRVLLDSAVAQLEREWFREVYQPFAQNLAPFYPFKAGTDRDAALQDFEQFFAPGGTLQTFYNQKLKLFVEDYPQQSGALARAGLLRREVTAALASADAIRRAYFTTSGSLDVEFALEPLNLTSNKRRSVMNLDGQLVEFNHGPRQSIPLVWPNTLRDNVQSRITLVPVEVNRSPRSLSQQGPWALFRLLENADLTGVDSTAVDVKFTVDEGAMRYRLHAGSNTNPFTQQLLSGFRLPRSLY
ncbi:MULTISPECIES: type VI secretion system membrane subunit TssM [unclassified Marinobacter]|uniref:type VI secretion system membrane subunit TssM n=1 Tax=unclassified Marinobacter TaxID=83889 RepID=UPI002010B33C|nr:MULTISPECIES: type VI secretion system membrane subunit TssM [unclassified Marinobacter]MCL1477685.1 type VI secretion system membrane subunit TssM [Marinobacter sp.]MCL1482262.1 type VI secretion system membrane subunit TssM [Marinobacter sp.]MCL1485804.1 type VI secretion system membrane subunit TssM [Marinobacter sp.]UQG55758.1 type VI secretion system membrane subunit TssM [Marinobacter sp. M4C]UQG64562.1 type VI secretion system membrane subunit TssM [Marinobacter sp. M2C]